MSGMSDNETCEKCGYEEAEYYLDAGLLYKTISCPKCGWVVSYSREIWVRENSMYDSSIIEDRFCIENMKEYSDEKIEKVLNLINYFGGTDGSHHKQWLINKILKTLTESKYEEWVKEYNDGENGPNTYKWDIGIAL